MNCDLYQNPYKTTRCSGSISPDGGLSVCWRHLQASRDYWMARAITQKERDLLNAVKEIWAHTEKHTTYVEGVGYTSRSDEQRCEDPVEHSYLALVEGTAWKLYRER